MLLLNLTEKNSFLHLIDPRARILVAASFSLWTVAQQQTLALFAGLLISFIFSNLAKLPLSTILIRLLPLNLFLTLMWLILPLTTPGADCFSFISISCVGIQWALLITLKANAIVISLTALIATIELVILGHALHQLGVPTKIIHLLLFTTRYFHVLYQTYQQLRRAMCVRCFQSQMNWHTYRSIGYLLGMLLVRSYARVQQIEMAMKCRGYTGQFYLLSHLHWQTKDSIFLTLFLFTLLLISLLTY